MLTKVTCRHDPISTGVSLNSNGVFRPAKQRSVTDLEVGHLEAHDWFPLIPEIEAGEGFCLSH